jgi:hypothetical protein
LAIHSTPKVASEREKVVEVVPDDQAHDLEFSR